MKEMQRDSSQVDCKLYLVSIHTRVRQQKNLCVQTNAAYYFMTLDLMDLLTFMLTMFRTNQWLFFQNTSFFLNQKKWENLGNILFFLV
jgi:hypothetical protein